MLKWLSTLLPQQKPPVDTVPPIEPRVIAASEHGIEPADISPNAINVMKRLNKAGFAGFLVGGGVRDLLLGGAPKDFDVATDATPEQVRHLFRNARIIGRRFKIVHVRYGREIIEVTTFRGQAKDSAQQIASEEGQLLRDNVYGDLESDALRRDFTTNALYYAIADECIHDFAGGLDDIQARQIRMIGDPVTRYKEDPVRLLRAVRFAAKLGFTIEEQTAAPIREQAQLLANIPPARLFEEVLKLFLGGSAMATFEQLREYQLFAVLFPQTDHLLDENPHYLRLIEQVMVNTDKRIRAGKRITPAFIYAAFLWPPLQEALKSRPLQKGESRQDIFHDTSQGIIARQLHRVMIPKRFTTPMRQIWELQTRLMDRGGKKAYRTVQHPKFRAGYDFLLLREDAGEDLGGLGGWWTRFQYCPDTEKEAMLQELNGTRPPKRRKQRRIKSSLNTLNDSSGD